MDLPAAAPFLDQFAELRARYRFLVLWGRSGTGKTSWARHVTGDSQQVLEVNCAATPEPDLRGYKRHLHKRIVCDEASPRMVLAQKKLFQSPPCMVQLGASSTNCHAYEAFVSGTGFIACSNTWVGQLELLSPADQEWIGSNSIAVHVDEELWAAG